MKSKTMNDVKLRIAMLSAHSCPVGDLGAKDTGGMSVYIRELSRELGKKGHTVDLYTRVHDPVDPRVEDLSENVRLIHLRAGREAGIQKMAIYFSLPEFTFNLENYWQDNGLKYDIVFSHYWMSALVGKYLQCKYKIPYMAMYHTLGAVKNAIGIGEGEPALRIVSERDTIGESRRVIVATEKEKQDIIRCYGAWPGKISVVPCGVNMDLFRPLDKAAVRSKLGLNDEKMILYVGRIDPLKGIGRLLQSMPLLDNAEKTRLIVIGGDENSREELGKLKDLAAALGIGERVTFQGLIKHDRLPEYYNAADVCVTPSYYESFGLVPLESLACGTPVVATDVGDLRNIIRPGETGYIVPDNTPVKLAAGIMKVLSLPPLDPASRLAVRESVRAWDWANVAGQVAAEMRAVVDRKLAPVT
ncbi:MAG: glycosyltransferase [Dehalococcoidales bacterium]|jgi:D-inositol-3-phosphate glycosyltransferase